MPPATGSQTARPPNWRSLLRGLAIALALLCHSARADTWVDTHDEPAPAWQIETASGAKQLKRERVRVPGRLAGEETGAERIIYVAPPGASAWAWRTLPPAAVIEELKLHLEGRIPVPGAFLAAEVVLPHSADEEGEPIRLRVRSAAAARAKQGEVALTIQSIPRLLQREVRVWRLANRGKPIDPRGAYVSRMALVLPGTGRPSPAWVRETRAESLVTPLERTEAGLIARQDNPDQASNEPGGRVRLTRVTLHSDGFRALRSVDRVEGPVISFRIDGAPVDPITHLLRSRFGRDHTNEVDHLLQRLGAVGGPERRGRLFTDQHAAEPVSGRGHRRAACRQPPGRRSRQP